MKTILVLVFVVLEGWVWGQAPRLVAPVGHTGQVSSVAFSPDGKYILTGSLDDKAYLWDLQGHLLQIFSGHADRVQSVAFSPDGKYVLTGSSDRTAILWDFQGKVIRTFKSHKGDVLSVAFSPDGKYILAGCYKNSAILWDLQGRKIQTFKGRYFFYDINAVAFAPDGKSLLTSGNTDNNTVTLWDIKGHKIQDFKGSVNAYITSVAFSPDGKHILTGNGDITATLWDLEGHELQVYKGHTSSVEAVSFSPEGRYVLTGSKDNTIKLWDLQGRPLQTFKGHGDYINSVAFAPDGKHVLSGSSDKSARLWDISGHEIQTFTGHSNFVNAVRFSPDGKHVLVGSSDKLPKLWNLQTNTIQIIKGHSGGINTVDFSPDGKYVLTGSADSTVRLWDLQGRRIETFPTQRAYSRIRFSIFCPDGKHILMDNEENGARLTDLQGQKMQTFSGFFETVAVSPDNKYLVTANSYDKTPQLWDRKTGLQIEMFKSRHAYMGTRALAFAPDSNYVLTGGLNKAELWSLTGKKIQTFKDHDWLYVTALRFSPDGKHVLTASMDKTAKLWTLKGEKIHTFKGHISSLSSVDFSPDGKYLLTGSEDNSTRFWDTNTGKELAALIFIDSTDWVVTTPSGLFDASPGAMKLMYYVIGLEVIDLEQLKDRYYEPGLLTKIMGFTEGGLRPVDELNNIALYPAITKAIIESDHLKIQLEARKGGIGNVALLLNDNIELAANVNPERKADFEVDLNRFAAYFLPDTLNHLSLRTYNADGWLKSPAYPIDYRPSKTLTRLKTKSEQELEQIHLYALVVGTSNFRGQQLNLKYPDKDATAFADALRISAAALFGKNVDVQLLTTSAEPWPRKARIDQVMKQFAAKAGPNDILLVYLSGHGITYPPNSEKGQFYYLTTDISSDKLDDPVILATNAIAQDTLQEWIRQVKARKRILILDACNSGRVVERLEPGAKELNSDQRRALERMKDRSGMFVLAGSAADKSSYEASRYGHGLLTYSLLNNMPLVAAANKHFIDVDKLFANVREEVPRLAKGIGKVQDPELIGGETYAIGVIDENVRIAIPEEKPVFVRTSFMDSQKNKDLLHLETAVNDYLERRATEKDPAIAYWAVEEFSGDHYYLGGQYQQHGETVSGKATLYREDKELATFPFTGEKNALGKLAEEIVVAVFGWLDSHRD